MDINVLSVLDGNLRGSDAFKGYSLQVLVAILMVFAILGIIIGVTTLIFKVTGLFDLKKELDESKKAKAAPVAAPATSKEVVITDDDMMAAALVASIDYQNEVKTDVKIVSIREIK